MDTQCFQRTLVCLEKRWEGKVSAILSKSSNAILKSLELLQSWKADEGFQINGK